MHLILAGRPITKKNSQKIITNMKTGRPMVIPSEQYRQFESDCLKQITGQFKKKIARSVMVHALYYMPNRVSWPDLTGLMESTADILQKAEVLENDRHITSWGRSRIVGIDKINPRTEIYIEADNHELTERTVAIQ